MGFTIEDMLTLTGDRYQMSMIAGSRGWSNSISWVLMVEDFTILRNFVGKELAVTMGEASYTDPSAQRPSCGRADNQYRSLY